MSGYMSLEEQVDKEFVHAQHRAVLHLIAACLRGHPEGGTLPAFNEARRSLAADNRVYLGRRYRPSY